MTKYYCCDKEANNLVALFEPADYIGRFLCTYCRFCCDEHAQRCIDNLKNGYVERVKIKLSASTRDKLVKQVIAQSIGHVMGYLPKSDVRQGLSYLRKVKT